MSGGRSRRARAFDGRLVGAFPARVSAEMIEKGGPPKAAERHESPVKWVVALGRAVFRTLDAPGPVLMARRDFFRSE